jgi:hypothetical protein
MGSTIGKIFEDGLGTAGTPEATDPTYYTADQSDARFAAMGTTAPRYIPAITALTGGGSTALDGLATTALSATYLVNLLISDAQVGYVLRAGTDAESSPNIIRPDDYNASTNAKVWKKCL